MLGDPGAGKSAVMSSLVSQSEYDLIAYYFCDAKQNTESLRASNFVNFVIFSLAGREDIPYRYRLLEKAHKSSLPEVLVFLKGKASEGVSPHIIFAEYVLEILSGLPAPPSEDDTSEAKATWLRDPNSDTETEPEDGDGCFGDRIGWRRGRADRRTGSAGL